VEILTWLDHIVPNCYIRNVRSHSLLMHRASHPTLPDQRRASHMPWVEHMSTCLWRGDNILQSLVLHHHHNLNKQNVHYFGWDIAAISNVQINLKLQHPPPPPIIPRAFDCASCPGRGEFERCVGRVGNLNWIWTGFISCCDVICPWVFFSVIVGFDRFTR